MTWAATWEERKNVAGKYPEKVAELQARLQAIRGKQP